MKMLFSLLLAAVFLLCSPPPSICANNELPIVTGEWPPYTSERIGGLGCAAEIVTAVVRDMGMTPIFTFLPWKRGEAAVEKGRFFAVFPYIATEERGRTFDFSDPLMATRWLFFYNARSMKKKPSWNTLADLRQYRFGGGLGYAYEEDFKKAGLQVEYVAADDQNFMKLHSNRIDLTLTDEVLGWDAIDRLYPGERGSFGTLDKPYTETSLHLMVSRRFRDAAALRKRFDLSLRRIRENGTYEAVMKKYGLAGKR